MKPAVTAVLLLLTFSAIISTEARPNENGVWNAGLRQARDDECGPASGSCAPGLCCSLYNECGTSVAHCNVSLGCKNKWGECH
ncbi:hypothetical protein DAPPUDRAFT_305362 [Daphnia pulex]|uniref:Chitin-binding type-1 domain-containing protein n=1 Tax=Daphnia pulex TaxID=6669 RepID=E9GSB0_DAPPU|nr:hypothetical protein DAPPUDRAFT_305362 [Daphnia pulex]|eukprot:EFX77701.1 hypothetical protein DAPPUDRAFT_305362 [Daphnia pulex]